MNEHTTEEIEELVRRYPLPAGASDVVLNRNQVAELFDVSTLTITAWVNAGMPVEKAGAKGTEYEFRASACWAWRLDQLQREEERKRQARASVLAMRAAMSSEPASPSVDLVPRERAEVLRVQIQAEALAADRRQLLRREDVRELVEALLKLVRDTMAAAPDRVERIEAMPPRVMDALVDVCDDIADDLRDRIELWLAELARKREETPSPAEPADS